jgi:hypothetical protein
MNTAGQKLLEQLLTEDLSGVTFVRDYLQLQFNPPPTINVYSRCTVECSGDVADFGDPAFANLLIAQVGKHVAAVSDDSDVFTITFEDGSRIRVPFSDAAFEGPEAFEFLGREQHWAVWPG